MKLIFHGHDERYVVEQSLMALFPGELPVYEPAARAWVTGLSGRTPVSMPQGRSGRPISRRAR